MNRRGSVLIIVLWSVFLLAMLAVAIHAYVTPYLGLSGKLMDRTKMYYFANAGVERAIFEVENDDTELYDGLRDSWSSNDAAFNNVSIGGGVFSAIKDPASPDAASQYGLMDEEGKININRASQQVLKNLFEKIAQADPKDADALADSVIDWRDADDGAHKDGKENDYYESLEHPYSCKNSDFEVKEELLLVAGVTPEIFDAVKDHITIYGEGTVNVNTASIPALVSLGLDEALAAKIVHFRDGAGLEKDGEAPEGVFTNDASIVDLLSKAEHLSGSEIAQVQRVAPLLGVKSNNFRGNITGAYALGGKTEKIAFVYDRTEQVVKYWREG